MKNNRKHVSFFPEWNKKNIRNLLIACVGAAFALTLFEEDAFQRSVENTLGLPLRYALHFTYVCCSMFIAWFVGAKFGHLIINKVDKYTTVKVLGINFALQLCLTVLFLGCVHASGLQAVTLHQLLDELALNIVLWGIVTYLAVHYMKLQHNNLVYSHADLSKKVYLLESRIKPELFFDALYGLNALVPESNRLARKNIADIIDFYSLTLQETDLIELEEELALCNTYLDIKNVQREKPIVFKWDFALGEYSSQQTNVVIPSMMIMSYLEVLLRNTFMHAPHSVYIYAHMSYRNSQIEIAIFPDKSLGMNEVVMDETMMQSLNELIELNQEYLRKYFGDTAITYIQHGNQDSKLIIAYPMIL